MNNIAAWRRFLPWALTLSRFALGPILLKEALSDAAPGTLISLLVLALLSDIFDGVLARRWGTVTPGLRITDSWADICFYSCVGIAIAHLHPDLAMRFRLPLLITLGLYIIRWIQDLTKYGRCASYHATLSRLAGAALFFGSIAASCSFHPALFLGCAFVIGVACHLEAMAMTAVLPRWTHDVHGLGKAIHLARHRRIQEAVSIPDYSQNRRDYSR